MAALTPAALPTPRQDVLVCEIRDDGGGSLQDRDRCGPAVDHQRGATFQHQIDRPRLTCYRREGCDRMRNGRQVLAVGRYQRRRPPRNQVCLAGAFDIEPFEALRRGQQQREGLVVEPRCERDLTLHEVRLGALGVADRVPFGDLCIAASGVEVSRPCLAALIVVAPQPQPTSSALSLTLSRSRSSSNSANGAS
jgi:hypothetical protein